MGQVLRKLDQRCKGTKQVQGKGGKFSVFMFLDSQAHACLSGELFGDFYESRVQLRLAPRTRGTAFHKS